MNAAESFSASYAEARARFRDAASGAGGALESIANPNRGPDGGDLSTDVAWFGPRDAEKVLVTVCGTHGVEGFCGSGAQVDWLRRGEAAALPAGVAALAVHAINPYGFAWLRRVTEENVDLNRNWIDFAAAPPANPGYDELASAAVPDEWSEAAQVQSAATLRAYAQRHGALALQQALSGGQFRHADGVFYGGTAPSWARRTQEAIYREYLGGAGQVAIIDYHTGLGPWGFGEAIMTEAARTPAFRRARGWYGARLTTPADGSSASAPIAGDNLGAAPGLLPHAEVTGMALEFGTVSLARTFLALRADAWLHARGDPASPQGRAIKAMVREAFYGDADDWKGMIAGQSLVACRQAVAGLGG